MKKDRAFEDLINKLKEIFKKPFGPKAPPPSTFPPMTCYINTECILNFNTISYKNLYVTESDGKTPVNFVKVLDK